jgi:hypothetical protein
MTLQLDLDTSNLTLLVGPWAKRPAFADKQVMAEFTARLAMRGQVHVLDGGNSFDAYRVARLIRRQTPRLDQLLERILVARAFTCYQVVTLFEQAPATPAPHLVLDLLATFCDESVSAEEGRRLLKQVLLHLDRLRKQAPIVVTVRRPPQPERAGLVDALVEAADHVLIRERPAPATNMSLF